MAGRPLQLRGPAGDVIARARRHGVSVPTIETCAGLIRGAERLQGQA